MSNNNIFVTWITIIELEYPEINAYFTIKDFGNNLILEIRKDSSHRFHTFLLYEKLSKEYIIEASKEFAAIVISDDNQGN